MRMPQWVHTRIRRKPQVYLMPTRDGWWWIGTLVLLFLMGWGYSNNLCLALAVLLMALTVVLLLEAHFNLDGLKIESLKVEDQYQGQDAAWKIWWQSKKKRARKQVMLNWDGEGPQGEFQTEEDLQGVSHGVWVFAQRGVWRADHIKLTSTFPLGLFRAWSYQRVPVEAWVYPAPVIGFIPSQNWDDGVGAAKSVESESGDEPGELRRYHEGDSPTRIAWKAMARGLPVHTKTFSEDQAERAFYSWPFGAADEVSRSQLSYRLREHNEMHESWALQVGAHLFAPDAGPHHFQVCMRALTEAP